MSVFLTQSAARAHRRGAHWHWPANRRRFGPPPGSACGDHRLATDTGRDPTGIPATDRCAARGCRERWTAVDQPADLMSDEKEH